jgi:hypothetical protein
MRAILISHDNLEEIRVTAGWKTFRRSRQYLQMAEEIGVKLFFIPEWQFPETKGVRRRHFVTKQFLFEKFLVGPDQKGTPWVTITMKRRYLPSLEE